MTIVRNSSLSHAFSLHQVYINSCCWYLLSSATFLLLKVFIYSSTKRSQSGLYRNINENNLKNPAHRLQSQNRCIQDSAVVWELVLDLEDPWSNPRSAMKLPLHDLGHVTICQPHRAETSQNCCVGKRRWEPMQMLMGCFFFPHSQSGTSTSTFLYERSYTEI